MKTDAVGKWENELYSIESYLLALFELFEINSYEAKKSFILLSIDYSI